MDMDNKMKFVVVMSTYNGEKYIETQIESILKQEGVTVLLIVRDDGSTDKTTSILERYQEAKKLIWYSGPNLKPAKSFLDLLEYIENNISESKYDYVAFADQDDVWDSQKLYFAGNHLIKNYDLYYCSMEAFYDNNPNKKTLIRAVILEKGEILFRNSVAGCTMAFNKKVLHTINLYNPSYIEMHDSWILRVCTILGYNIYADSTPLIKYRIHGKNVCGSSISLWKKIKNHTRNMFFHNKEVSSETAHELLNGYSNDADLYYKDLLLILDRKQGIKNRKIKLLKKVMTIKFSTFSREMTCFFQIMIGKI